MVTRPVAITAQFTAKAREIESQRTNALFVDPWAHLFSGEAGKHWWARHAEKDAGLTLVLRTRYLDDMLAAHRNDAAVGQVVILAAGYNTRAYRLNWPSQTRLFEIDQAGVLAYKDQILTEVRAVPACDRKTIGLDLEHGWEQPLLGAGFDPDLPSIWVVEGLLLYLSPPAARQVMETLTRMAAIGSWLGLDLLNKAAITSPLTRDRTARLAQRGMAWQFGVDDPPGWIEPLGWKANITTVSEAARLYQRNKSISVSGSTPALELPDVFFVTAQRL